MDLQQLTIERRPRATRRRGSPWPWRLGLGAVLAGACWLFWSPLREFVDRLRLPVVQTMVVQAPAAAAAAAVSGTAANGYVVASRRAALSSDVPGRIVELHVKEGSVVKRGDVVARLYSDEYRAELERAKAELLVAAATVARSEQSRASAVAEEQEAKENAAAQEALAAEAQAQQAFAASELRRISDLVRQGINSPRDQEQAQTQLDAAQARVRSQAAVLRAATAAVATAAQRVQVAAMELQVLAAQQQAAAASVQQAQAALDKTDVRAPFDGIVVLKDAEVGEVVSPNVQSGGNARGAVCTMVDFDSLEIQAHVPETALGSVRVGGECAVFLDAEAERRLPGVVDRIWPTADRQKATVEVRIVLRERSELLRPEMTVRVVFLARDQPAPSPGDVAPSAVLVPEMALVEHSGGLAGFVVERDTVRLVTVRVGERRAGRAAVTEGLHAGQRLVLDPPASLRDGDRVRLAAAQ